MLGKAFVSKVSMEPARMKLAVQTPGETPVTQRVPLCAYACVRTIVSMVSVRGEKDRGP